MTEPDAAFLAPYAELRVLDLGQGIAGPYCGMLFALHGADVIKIEPTDGEWGRFLGRKVGDHGELSLAYNRGKRGLALDMKAPEAQAIAFDLARRADVVVESFRPGVAARLGVGYEAVTAENPGVIYVSVSGFGQKGPHAQRPCTDRVAQAFSGLTMLNTGLDGMPHPTGPLFVDVSTGLIAFQACQAALFAKARAGKGRKGRKGRRLDIALTQGIASMIAANHSGAFLRGDEPEKPLNAASGAYKSADGWVQMAYVKEEQFARLCTALGHPEVLEDPRFQEFATRTENEAALRALFAGTVATKPTAHWVEVLGAADILSNPINDLADWVADPHVQASGGAEPVHQPGIGAIPLPRIPGIHETPGARPRAPGVGEHSRAILRDMKMSDAAIDDLAARGVVAAPDIPAAAD